MKKIIVLIFALAMVCLSSCIKDDRYTTRVSVVGSWYNGSERVYYTFTADNKVRVTDNLSYIYEYDYYVNDNKIVFRRN
jgi:hypothetical protein